MIKRLTIREQKIFIMCLVVLAVYVGYNGVVKPLKARISFVEQKTDAQQRKLAKYNRTLRKAKVIDKQYQAYVVKYQQTLANEQIMSSMVSDIEKVAEDLELMISDMKPRKVKKGDLYNTFSVSLRLDSTLKDTVHFLYILQGQPYAFDAEEIRFDKGSRKKENNIKTSLVLRKIFIP